MASHVCTALTATSRSARTASASPAMISFGLGFTGWDVAGCTGTWFSAVGAPVWLGLLGHPPVTNRLQTILVKMSVRATWLDAIIRNSVEAMNRSKSTGFAIVLTPASI